MPRSKPADIDDVRIVLRLPPDLHTALTEMAQRELRSLNSQIDYLLRNAADKRLAGRRGQQS
jgi:hypothetical protein